MRLAVLAAAVAVFATGCLGQSDIIVSGEGGPPTPRTELVLTAPGGAYQSREAALDHCPRGPGLTCRAVRFSGGTDARWWQLLGRNLECPRKQGYYPNNAAACQALTVLLRNIRSGPTELCPCPAPFGPRYTIEGRYHLQDVTLRFRACPLLCGAPKATTASFHLLFPPTNT